MSKILNVNTGNYVARVASGNTITLDTGAQAGTVVITGDLQINGETTTVSSQQLDLVDNIITLNKNESGAGVTLNQAGIQIDRGSLTDALLVFDEDISFNDPITQTVKPGTFVLKTADNAIIGLRTNAITTAGGDLFLINSGTGVISVSGTADYENQVTDDDDIPNKKYVDDTVTTGIQTITIQSIQRGDSALNLYDSGLDAGVSAFRVSIDGTEVALFKSGSTEIEDIVFENNTISTVTSATDLTLSSSGTSFVVIDGVLKMPIQSDATSFTPGDNIVVYGKDPGFGNSGVYYTNKNNYEDELISTNRSLMFSMLF
jgi:hypothetical protein|tara:strand:- start:1354 stop:2304 length:951 start_codon:yes stop_codon:yes gene_type:complete